MKLLMENWRKYLTEAPQADGRGWKHFTDPADPDVSEDEEMEVKYNPGIRTQGQHDDLAAGRMVKVEPRTIVKRKDNKWVAPRTLNPYRPIAGSPHPEIDEKLWLRVDPYEWRLFKDKWHLTPSYGMNAEKIMAVLEKLVQEEVLNLTNLKQDEGEITWDDINVLPEEGAEGEATDEVPGEETEAEEA